MAGAEEIQEVHNNKICFEKPLLYIDDMYV